MPTFCCRLNQAALSQQRHLIGVAYICFGNHSGLFMFRMQSTRNPVGRANGVCHTEGLVGGLFFDQTGIPALLRVVRSCHRFTESGHSEMRDSATPRKYRSQRGGSYLKDGTVQLSNITLI